MITYYPAEQTERLRALLGDDLYQRQQANRHLCVPHGNGYFIAFYYCNIADWTQEERVCIDCTQEQVTFFGSARGYRALIEKLPPEEAPFRALAQFFSALTAEDIDVLDHLEQEINALEDALVSGKPHRNISRHIVIKRRELLRLKRYYDQLDLIFDRLCENEESLLDRETLRLFTALAHRVERLTASVIHLRECVTQVREAYQAQIDIEQNQIMKIFTVLTAVFFPLTLIVGWYGMNFHMPEYNWAFGYGYVILLSVVVCGVCCFIFKKKKWY